jgi:hypothetical protein
VAAIAALAAVSASAPAAAAPAAPPEQAPAPLGADALWAWWWPSESALVDAATGYGFDRVLLYAEGGFDAKVRKAIAALTSHGIAVEALGGENRWGTTQRAGMLDFIRAARRYERNAPPGAQLAGVHVDVEPYDLPAWSRDPDRVGRSLVASLAAAKRAAGPLPLSADIPFWYEPGLARDVIRATDSTTIMAYRDSGPEVVEAARAEVRIAGRLGRTATVGVETDEVRPRSVTFFEEGRGALVAAIAEIRSELAGEAGFGGVAVHHLESLGRLVP